MPIAAQCPNCGSTLSETSIIALAPVCEHCRTVITEIGGTLGLTGAYGVNDPTITRRRVEADLAVFREYQMKYRGMLEDCKQRLQWGLERYAQLPHRPQLLELKEVPPLINGEKFGIAIFMLPLLFLVTWVASVFFFAFVNSLAGLLEKGVTYWVIGGLSMAEDFWFITVDHFHAKAANGNRPRENARRQKAFEDAMAIALKAAEPLKAAEDHRLRFQIRELEGLIKTVDKKETEVRQILATL